MLIYKKCSEVNIDLVYEAFNRGFSDYIIKLEMPKEFFVWRTFGPEGNSKEHSFIAFDDEKPIGVALGGIREYEGIKTMRCGGLAVASEYRGKGVSKDLMDLHKEAARKEGCKQLFLEVITSNDRAVNFYKNYGYEKIYELSYYVLEDLNKLKSKDNLNLNIKTISMLELKRAATNTESCHINWQNDMEYIEKLEGQVNLGAFIEDGLVGSVSVSKAGKISFIWVDKFFRHKGIAAKLITKACEELKLNKIGVSFPNNSSLQGYFNHMNFIKEKISQYEMYLFL